MQAALPELRPLSIGEVLDVGIKIVWRNAATMLRIVVPIVLPVQFVSSLVTVSAESGDLAVTSPTGEVTYNEGEMGQGEADLARQDRHQRRRAGVGVSRHELARLRPSY